MATFAREGFCADTVGRALGKSLFNPYLALPIAAAATLLTGGHPTLSNLNLKLEAKDIAKIGRAAFILGVTGVALSVNDFLTKWSANNWTRTKFGDWNWDEEIVVVTGASTGIGASVVQNLLARNPCTTIVVFDYEPLAWTPPAGSKIYFYQCDLSDAAVVKSTCAKVRAEVGHPTVLVNNAGISRGASILDGSYADVQITIRTNLTAPFLLIKEFLPEMVKHNHGHIISISSTSSLIPPPYIVDYAATKAGVTALHEGLQLELSHLYKAPKVRLSLGIFNFVRTKIFATPQSGTGQAPFIFPVLHTETVAEHLVDALYSGYGSTIYLPETARVVSKLRGGPEWLWRLVRGTATKLTVDFTGRHKIDPETFKLI
ncbi:putative short-chain dehydrogenase [Bombardia bombarda]|uniref:Short-chain dehydrogenase n=1 Tax=Bombardia bombarda TaxID=252184 RepID=A0AA39TM11_9PEZI|nr:putative short-chain dehydrogenase [Bombardia bombarda]